MPILLSIRKGEHTMRKLILKRKKAFVASLIKIKVFLEDDKGELELGTVKCKEIGTLKNGRTLEYDIPNERIYVFVVFSKILPNEYHFCYDIPAGDANVELFTAPKLNPVKGNPFEIYSKQDLIDLGKADGW